MVLPKQRNPERSSNMELKGKTVREQIWKYLKAAGLSNHGVAGLMGNFFAKSRLDPKNLEDLCERRQ